MKLLGLLLTLNAWAIASGDKATFSNKYQDGANPSFLNYIKNPSCLRNAVNITGTNTTPSRNTTTPLSSIADCQSTLDSATDTVDFATATLDRSLKGGNCEVSMNYKLTLGSGNTIQLQARINSATVASADLVTSDNGTATVNFPCGDLSNAPSLRIAQTAGSSSQAINVANVYLGAARNIGTVAQATLVGSLKYAATTNCIWASTSTSFANVAADTDCPTASVTGAASAPGTKIPAIVFANGLAPGEYMFVISGLFANTGSDNTFFRISDGTNSTASGGVGDTSSTKAPSYVTRLNYSTAQGSTTFNFQLKNINGTSSQIQTTANDFEISVYRFPSSSEIAVTSQNGDTNWASYTPTFTGFGTVSTQSFFWKREGSDVLIRGKFTAGTTTATEARVSLPTGLTTASTDLIPAITIAGMYVRGGHTAVTAHGGSILMEPSTTYVTFDTSETFGSASAQTQLSKNGDPNFSGSGDIVSIQARIPILGWSTNQGAPILVGSVTSNSTGAERVERAVLDCDAASSITSQSGTWLSSIGNVSSGACALTVAAGIFSAAPTCVAAPSEVYTGNVTTFTVVSTSATSLSLDCRTDGGGGPAACSDVNATIICMGSR